MNGRSISTDPRAGELNRMIQEASNSFPPIPKADGKIIDFIMTHPDLELTSDQIGFFRHTSPPFCPDSADYFAVLERMLSESSRLGDTALVKSIYTTIPFYPGDEACERKAALILRGIEDFLAAGARHDAGELYMHLAWSHNSTERRLEFCNSAIEYLDKSSVVYAAALALRKMLRHMEIHPDRRCSSCFVFGDKLFARDGCVYISPMPYAWYICNQEEQELYFNTPVLKGYNENLNPWGYQNNDKVIADETLAVGESNCLYKENELIRHPDEKVICRADGKEYNCLVFSYIIGDVTVRNYFADGIGLVRAVLDGGKYSFELCDYELSGGEGLLPLCAGNRWRYRQSGCDEVTEQIIERKIVSEHDGEYLLSGLDYTERI